MTSLSAAFSSDRSAYRRLSRLFWCSSSLRRLPSDAAKPPYCAFHLEYVAELIP